ncbi:MAG: hypothetical protein RL414_30 [Actinomycetota bacterium]
MFASRRIIVWTAFLVIGLDSATKKIALAQLSDEPVKILGNFLKLRLLHNPGAAFSVGETKTFYLSLFAILALILVLYLSRRLISKPWAYVAGLVIGGITGNLLDRIFRTPGFLRGEVIDWIEVPHWPTFNLADSALFIAAGIACILTFKNIEPLDTPSNNEKIK